MRYKVGDKVRVRQWDDMVKEFGTDEAGSINQKTVVFTKEMKKFCGGVYEICSVLERIYLLKDGAKTICWHFTDQMLEDINLLSYTTDKNCEHITTKKEDKEMKQKTQRERLEEQLKEYQRDSGINSIEIIVPGKIVKVTMDDCINSTYTVFANFKDNTKKFKKAMKVYEIQQKLKVLDEEEERIRANKKRKKIAQKKRRAERLAEEKLKETKEAAKIYAEELKSVLAGYDIPVETTDKIVKDMNTRV